MRRFFCILLFAVAVIPAWARGSHGQSGNDRVGFGQDITVHEDETVGDIACAFCSVHLEGDAHGDVAIFLGSLTVDEGHSISGDVALLGGDVSLGEGASIAGDLAILAGDLNLAPSASVHGDRAVFPGRFWLLVPLAPLFVVVGVIWLIVWLVRRNRYSRRGYYPPVRRF